MSDEPSQPQITGLSQRESAVALRFADGMTYREISEALFIAPATVRAHLSSIYQKLGIRNKASLATRVAGERAQHSDSTASHNESSGDRPLIIAVLPFATQQTEERWQRLADGVATDIMVDLARYRDLAVISRQTMMSLKHRRNDVRSIGRDLNADYVIEGSLQLLDDQLRVRVQLVDAKTAFSLWSGRYDMEAHDLFVTQDDISERVINTLATYSGTFASLRRAVAKRIQPSSLHAYDHYLLGLESKHRFTREANAQAIAHFQQALDLDPHFARAWCALGLAHAIDVANSFCTDVRASISAWETSLVKALELDPSDSHARICYGDLKAQRGDVPGAAIEHEAALSAAPNDADTLSILVASKVFVTGDPRDGYSLAKRAIALNPLAPPWYFGMLGRASFVVGRYPEAVSAFHRAPHNLPINVMLLAMCHGMMDEHHETLVLTRRLKEKFPEFTLRHFIETWPVANPPALLALHEGAKRIGIAE